MYATLIYQVCMEKNLQPKNVQVSHMLPFIKDAPWFDKKKVHGPFGSIKDRLKKKSMSQLQAMAIRRFPTTAVKAPKAPVKTMKPKAPIKTVKPRKPEVLPYGLTAERIEAFRKEGVSIKKILKSDHITVGTKANGSHIVTWAEEYTSKGKYIRRRRIYGAA
jgi:hypothetical protein